MLRPYYQEEFIEAGCDEAGRGCLAGPVVAAAAALFGEPSLYLDFQFNKKGERKKGGEHQKGREHLNVRDSKLVPEAERAPLAEAVKIFVAGFSIAESSVEEIEKLNILYASHLAMERAVETLEKKLKRKADYILIDGHIVPRKLLGRGVPLIKGDQRSLTIACASIIAKVYRDELMVDLDSRYPGYGLKEHKGYPTPFHKKKIVELGITALHRKTFRGVKVEKAEEEGDRLF